MKFSKDSFVRASIFLLIISAVVNALNFLYHFISARMLGPEEYGIVASLFSIIYLIGIGATTIQNSVTKFTADFKAKKDYGKINYLFKHGTFKLGIYSLIVFLAYLALSPVIANFLKISISSVLIVSPMLIIFVLMPLNRGIFQGLQQFKHLGWNMFIEGMIKLGLAILLIYLGFKANGALIAVILAAATGYFIAFPFIKLGNKTKKFNTSEIYKFSTITLVALSLITLIYSVDVFLAKHFLSSQEAGYYAALSLLGKIVFFGSTAIGLVMFPKISEHAKNKKISDKIFKKSVIFTSVIGGLITLTYFLFSNIIVRLVFGESYSPISNFLGWFGIAMAFISLSYICVLHKLALGKKKFIFVILATVFAEIILIGIFHSFISIVAIMIILNLILLLMLIRK